MHACYAFARCLAAARRAANAASAFSARLAPAAGRLPGVAALTCANGSLAGLPGVAAPCAQAAVSCNVLANKHPVCNAPAAMKKVEMECQDLSATYLTKMQQSALCQPNLARQRTPHKQRN